MFENVFAVVLVGGFGTRLRAVLQDVPKPLAPVSGAPFLEWVLRYWKDQGIENFFLSAGYLAEKIESFSEERAGTLRLRAKCVAETNPLGTAGGFLNAIRDCVQRPQYWLVINGDSLALADLKKLVSALDANPHASAAIVGVSVDDCSRYGTLSIDEQGRIRSFDEKKPGSGLINAGIYLFRDASLSRFPKNIPLSFESDVFPTLLAGNTQILCIQEKCAFIDIGIPDALAAADHFVKTNLNSFGATHL